MQLNMINHLLWHITACFTSIFYDGCGKGYTFCQKLHLLLPPKKGDKWRLRRDQNLVFFLQFCRPELQGVSNWNVSFKLTLTDRNMQVRFCLKVTVYSWGLEIWVSLTSFQKINLGWPQQPPPENSVWVFIILSKIFFSKHQNEIILVLRLLNSRTRMALKSSIVIFQTLKTSAASLPSLASSTSLASTASTAIFPQKTS